MNTNRRLAILNIHFTKVNYNLFSIAFLLIFWSNATTLLGQGVGINDNNSTPDASAMLDVKSTDKGILVPRMTTVQKIAIATPATGLLVFDNTTTSFWFYDGAAWAELGADSPFTKTGTVILPNTSLVNEATDDFVFGSTQLDDDGNTAHGNRFFFDKSKGAFRAGSAISTEWNDANLGNYSFAVGINTEASGDYSTAWGENNIASDFGSTVWGTSNIASNSFSTAWGLNGQASGAVSTAWGFQNIASSDMTTAWGSNNNATGNNSTASGYYTDAPSFAETSMGVYTTDYTPASSTNINAADRLFSIGNGTAVGSRSNALTIYKDGTMNINDAYNMPTLDGTASQMMTTDGAGNVSWGIGSGAFEVTTGLVNPNSNVDETTDDFVFGATQLADDGNTAHDHRFSFDKSKGAFRAGEVTGTQWDDASVGNNSIALGYNTTASGFLSTALGNATTASGQSSTALGSGNISSNTNSMSWGYSTDATGNGATSFGLWALASASYSTAWGRSSVASGSYSTAFGNSTTSSGSYSTAFGNSTTSSGSYSTTWGNNTSAPSGYETSIGQYNTNYTPVSTTGWDNSDRIFTIGNGTASGSESDAMVVLKDGKVGLGTDAPNSVLSIESSLGSLNGGLNLKDGAADWYIYQDATYGLRFRDDGSDRLTIDASGNVGIGTAAPAYKLEVSTNSAAKPGSALWTVTSDERLKTNIESFKEGLDIIKQINPIWFNYNGKANTPTDERFVGTLAQDLQKIAPYMVKDWTYTNDEGKSEDYLSVDYGALGFITINAVKEQQEMIESQQSEIDQLKKELQEIKALLKK